MATRDTLIKHVRDLAMDEIIHEKPEYTKTSKSDELSMEAMSLIAEYEKSRGALSDGMDVDNVVESFVDWLERRRAWGMMEGNTTIEVTITRKYGKIDVTLGHTRQVHTKDPKYVRIAREILTSEVEKAHDVYAAIGLPKVVHTQPAANSEGSETTRLVDFPPTRLSKKVDDGTVMYRVHGGQWSKFGVPIYDEVLTAAGLSKENIPDTGLTLSGFKATAQVEAGKPKRITRLEKEF